MGLLKPIQSIRSSANRCSIVETAYRATLEEQDDTILWFNHTLKNAGADIAILLRSNAVNYAVKGQDASGLRFGEMTQPHAPEIDKDVTALIEKGVPVYLVTDDAEERGLVDEELVSGVQKVSRRDLPSLLDRFDLIWHW
jgi:sulfur relay (sulfurtransferase) DsrF/TusC family protein